MPRGRLIELDLTKRLPRPKIHGLGSQMRTTSLVHLGGEVAFCFETPQEGLEWWLIDANVTRNNEIAWLAHESSVEVLQQLALPRRIGAD
jgi:hypothetical protein